MAKASKSKSSSSKSGSWARVSGGPVFACIDMGTNSFHMIVCRAESSRDGFEVISRVKEAVPFFRDSLVNHYIDDVALAAAEAILQHMIQHARERGATNIIAVATSAVRESRNGAEALEKLRQSLALDARTISGKEEARLIYLGVLFSMPKLKGKFAIVDIGGGSTELIAADRKGCHFTESYKLGAARLTRRFFKKSRPDPDSLRELRDEVVGKLRPGAAALHALGGFNKLIGTSGTVQALAKLDRVRAGRGKESLNGWILPIERLEELVEYIAENSMRGTRIKGVSQDRSETILAGSIVLLETMRSLGADDLIVCTSALREGMVVDRFSQTGWLNAGLEAHRDPRSRSVYALLEKYSIRVDHAEHVAYLARQLFEQTRGILHDYPEEVAHILWSASMLHDLGTYISRNGHHKHSYYLIRHGGLLGHSEEEVGMIASVARYHRGSDPKESHEAWLEVQEGSRLIVRDLAAFLRLAEALDRSHRQVIEEIKVVVSFLDRPKKEKGKSSKGKTAPRNISLVPRVKAGENCLAEAWALGQKKQLFEECFNVKLDILMDASAVLASSLTGLDAIRG